MGQYIARRSLQGVFTVFIISVITFCIFFMMPGNGGADGIAKRIAGKNPTPDQIAAIKEKMKLEEPKPVQYANLMKQLVTGELTSYNQQGVKVVPLALAGLPVTASLALFAAALWLTAGLTAGIVASRNPGTRLDSSLMVIALAGISMPIMWLALEGMWIFTDLIPIFPAGEFKSISEGGIFLWAYHLMLPAGTLAIVSAGVYARFTRTNIRQALNEEYIKTAKAKGIPERQVWTKHVLRTGLIPIVIIFGMDLGALMGGAIFTETIFNLPGIGYVLMRGIADFDFPILIACVLISTTFIITANLIVDVVQAAVDPRIRLK